MTVLSAQRFDNSRGGGCSTLEVRETSRKGRKTSEPRPVPLKETSVTGSVQGPLASLVLNQLFDCSFLKEGTAAEAVYRFPLPGDALVRGVTVTFGKVRIATRLAEREEAQEEYDDAVEKGRQAALVTREGDGHTGFGGKSACVDDLVASYLIDLKVPEDGAICL